MFGDEDDTSDDIEVAPTFSRRPIPAKSEENPPVVGVEEKVKLVNLLRQDCPILLLDEDGIQCQKRIDPLGEFGPIERARLTPQVDSLAANKRIRIEVCK